MCAVSVYLRCHVFHCFKIAVQDQNRGGFGQMEMHSIISEPTFSHASSRLLNEQKQGRCCVGGLVVSGQNSSLSRPILVWKG